MNSELDIHGVFVSSLLVTAVLGYVLTAATTRLLARVGFYRLVWHRALFDFALFIVLWAAVTALGARFGPTPASPR